MQGIRKDEIADGRCELLAHRGSRGGGRTGKMTEVGDAAGQQQHGASDISGRMTDGGVEPVDHHRTVRTEQDVARMQVAVQQRRSERLSVEQRCCLDAFVGIQLLRSRKLEAEPFDETRESFGDSCPVDHPLDRRQLTCERRNVIRVFEHALPHRRTIDVLEHDRSTTFDGDDVSDLRRRDPESTDGSRERCFGLCPMLWRRRREDLGDPIRSESMHVRGPSVRDEPTEHATNPTRPRRPRSTGTDASERIPILSQFVEWTTADQRSSGERNDSTVATLES